ncbi:hypothetical protein OPT61_g2340 [Boeremia exigua]|uniref:Uncharacterized protein n=1 Tax=Boeremia exigua TaxID=749465 RepID=A0ACC2ILX6_9PLEO|nr:hypothetical protein OPT61_g2340 [Boeremia exigua]
MLFTSQQPNIELPKYQTRWSWLFESRTPTFNPATVQGFTDVSTLKHISFTDLANYTKILSTIFYREFGLREGDVVVVYSKNSVWYPVVALAAVRIGAIACAVSPEYTTEEIAYALRLTKAKLFFTGAGSISNARLASSASELDAGSLLCMDANPDGLKSVQDLLKKTGNLEKSTQVPQFQIPAGKTNHDTCAYLCLSSGTTGLPKAVMISHGNIIAQCLQVQQITPKDHDKIVAALPFYHITGIVHEIHLPIAINAHTYVLPTYTLDSLLETVCRFQIEELLIVPPILIRLVRDPETVDKYDLSHIRRFSSGAAPLPREILDLLERKFPNTGFKQGYGMTESCSAITSHPPSKYAYKYADKVGMLVGSTSVKIIDPTTLEECGVGTAGEIWARGPQVAMGYLNNPSASAETFDKDGFLHTGDIGYVDEEGLLSITDRMKEMIKVKGIGVAPAELENLLLGHPMVNDVAVTGIPDDRAGERPKAFVVLKPGDGQDPVKAGRAILEYVKEKRARHKWMTEVEIVGSIPKSSAGKILRRKLREKAAEANGNIVVRDGAPQAKFARPPDARLVTADPAMAEQHTNDNAESTTGHQGRPKKRARIISSLTEEQLQHKRNVDRKAQRAFRQRTKDSIEKLEQQLASLNQKAAESDAKLQRELAAVRKSNQTLEQCLERISELASTAIRAIAHGNDTERDSTSGDSPGHSMVAHPVDVSHQNEAATGSNQSHDSAPNPSHLIIPLTSEGDSSSGNVLNNIHYEAEKSASMLLTGTTPPNQPQPNLRSLDLSQQHQSISPQAHGSIDGSMSPIYHQDELSHHISGTPLADAEASYVSSSAGQQYGTIDPGLEERSSNQYDLAQPAHHDLCNGMQISPHAADSAPTISSVQSLRSDPVSIVLPSHVLPTCPLDEILHNFLISRRDLLTQGMDVDAAAGPSRATVKALLDPQMTNDVHPVSGIMSEVLTTFAHVEQPEKLAFYYLMYKTMRWQIAPSKESYRAMPTWLRPTVTQITVQHAAWIDNIPWPGVRDILIENPEDHPFDLFSQYYSHNVSVNWPFDHMDAVTDVENNVVLHSIFEKHVSNLKNWTVSAEFQTRFPREVGIELTNMSSAQYHQDAIGLLKNPNLFISEALIDGQWVKKDSTFDVIEPSTATVLGKVSNCGLEDFQKAIASAETAGAEFYCSTTAHQKSATEKVSARFSLSRTARPSDAVSKGAQVLIGGTRVAPGFVFQPTVLSGVPHDALVATDETFGPLAPIFTFSDKEDALRLANATEFGLSGYFFSRNVSRVMRVAARLKVGMVGVNTGKISAAEAPFGGVGQSGFGREGSKYGLAEYQNIKAVTIGNFGL